MSSTTLRELEHGKRRHLVALSVGKTAAGLVLVLGLYAVFPADRLTSVGAFALLTVGLLLVAGVLGWQLRSIVRADYPGLRAVTALVLTVTLFVVVFSLAYLSLSSGSPESFSEQLDRISSFYFTVSVLSTVGFGDIAARTDEARLIATLQMVLDLTLVAVIGKVIYGSAKASLKGRQKP